MSHKDCLLILRLLLKYYVFKSIGVEPKTGKYRRYFIPLVSRICIDPSLILTCLTFFYFTLKTLCLKYIENVYKLVEKNTIEK